MRNLLSALALVIILSACGNNENSGEVTVKSEDGKTTTTVQTESAEKIRERLQVQAAELAKLPPANIDQLKTMLPQEVLGAKAEDVNATISQGTGIASAEYNVNDSTELVVTITDCGGPGGAGIFSIQYMSMLSLESDSEDEYTRSVQFDGKNGIEQCSKVKPDCTLVFFDGKRSLITLNGENISAAELRKIASSIN
jgi:hypothetical protein